MDTNTTLPLGPTPPDAETFQRWEASHSAMLASIDAEIPGTPYFGKPETAARDRQRIALEYTNFLNTHGLTAPPPKTEAEIREEQFRARWTDGRSPALDATMTELREAEEALTPSQREYRMAELRKDLGDDYDTLVEQAKAALKPDEKLDAVKSNKFLLLNLAALGRHAGAYQRARAAAGFGG